MSSQRGVLLLIREILRGFNLVLVGNLVCLFLLRYLNEKEPMAHTLDGSIGATLVD